MLGVSLSGLLGVSQAPWLITVQTTDVDQTYTVDINAGVSPVVLIEWGDGTVETFTTTGLKTHTYADADTYIIRLVARFASGGNIRLGSNAADKHRMIQTGVIPFIPGLSSFNLVFGYCSGWNGPIPPKLFDNNPQVNVQAFQQSFIYCNALSGSIPNDLFKYNVLADTFLHTFYSTALSGDIPANLFRYNINATNFLECFYTSLNLKQNANIFYADGEQSTRFLNQSVNFANCFNTGALAPNGVAPDLWNCSFGTGTPTTSGCWINHSISTLVNYNDIPAAWK